MKNHFKVEEQRKMHIWSILNSYMEFELQILWQYTSFNLNLQHISTINIILQHLNHVLEHLACIDCYFMLCVLSIAIEPEPEVTPEEEEECQYDPRQQGKQNPLIISI